MTGSRQAVVAGGGIGGASAAIALARTGWRVTLLERAPEIGALGAGLQLSPNANRLLARWGVLERLTGAVRPEAAVLRDGRSGRVIFRAALGGQAETRWGAPYLHIHRADLLAALLAGARALGVVFETGVAVTGFAETGAGFAVQCDRGERPADLLIGADGVRSGLAEALFGPIETRFTGQVAWRATLPAAALATPPPAEAVVWAGPGRHLVSYRLRGGDLVNLVGVEETPDWVAESWSEPGDPDRLRALFRGWHTEVAALLAPVETPLRWGLFDRPALPGWHRGRVTLLGDACHAMLPFMAQGAAMGIEDAAVLARCLARAETGSEIEAGLARYEGLRRPRTDRVQALSRRNGRLFHLGGGLRRGLTHGAIAMATHLAPGVATSRLDWLYGHDAEATAGGEP